VRELSQNTIKFAIVANSEIKLKEYEMA